MSIRLKKIIYWSLSILVALIFIGSAMGKLTTSEQSKEMAKTLGGELNITILAIIELVIVVLWLIPRTGVIATLLAASYLGGAIAVHFINNQPYIAPVIIEIILWAVALYRFPELWQRFFLNVDANDIDSIL